MNFISRWREQVQKLFEEALGSVYAKQIAAVFTMQVFSLLASFGISLLITNLLGAAAYGSYGYAFSWVNLLALFSCMGFEQLALKEIPAYQNHEKFGLIKGLMRYSQQRVFIITILVSGLLFGFSLLFNQPKDESMRMALWFALPALPLIAQINLRFCWLRSFHFNVLSQVADKFIRPLLTITAILILYFLFRNQFNTVNIVIASVGVMLIALIVDAWLVMRKINPAVSIATVDFAQQRWLKNSWGLFLVTFFYYFLGQVNLLVLGTLKGAEDAGVFGIASRISDLEGYILVALNVVLAPLISKYYAEGKLDKLQQLITRSLRFVFIVSTPVLLAFMLFPAFFLGLFGDEFGSGKFALIILSVSQIFNLATGSVGYLLTMTGNQRTAVRILGTCSFLSVILSAIFIHYWNVDGAAIAMASMNILLNTLMVAAVYRSTGLNPTILTVHHPVKPGFFIVGAPKSGTTSMYHYLKQHPDVFLPKKELNFFCSDLHFPHRILNEREFLNYYRAVRDEKAVGEVSVWPLFSKEAPEQIKRFNPSAKVIIMLRNPAEMIFSLHNDHVFNGNENIINFSKALDAQNERRMGVNIPPHRRGPVEGLFYFELGNYSQHAKRYYDALGKENVLVIPFDDFASHTVEVYKTVLSFIGVKENFQPNFKIYNARKAVRSKFLRRITVAPPKWLKELGRIFFPHQTRLRDWLMGFLWNINTRETEQVALSKESRKKLISFFHADILELQKITGQDFSAWLKD